MMYKIEDRLSFDDEEESRIRAVKFDHRNQRRQKSFLNSAHVKGILLMFLFTASLLGLPLVLPSLAPPPLILLLVPVVIMAALILLAVMPPQQQQKQQLANVSFD